MSYDQSSYTSFVAVRVCVRLIALQPVTLIDLSKTIRHVIICFYYCWPFTVIANQNISNIFLYLSVWLGHYTDVSVTDVILILSRCGQIVWCTTEGVSAEEYSSTHHSIRHLRYCSSVVVVVIIIIIIIIYRIYTSICFPYFPIKLPPLCKCPHLTNYKHYA